MVILNGQNNQPQFQLTFIPNAKSLFEQAHRNAHSLNTQLRQKEYMTLPEYFMWANTMQEMAAAEWLVHSQIIEIVRPFTEPKTPARKYDLIDQFFQPIDPRMYCTNRTIKEINPTELTQKQLQNTPEFIIKKSNLQSSNLQLYMSQLTNLKLLILNRMQQHQKPAIVIFAQQPKKKTITQ